MATREEVLLIRAAREGLVRAQVALGRRYLFGSVGLPKSLETGLYWLTHAARQGASDAWLLIGTHIPFEVAVNVPNRSELYAWYERAFDEGVIQAGLVLARLLFADDGQRHDAPLRRKAWQALERAAESGIAEAQWLLAQQIEKRERAADSGHLGTSCKAVSRVAEPLYLEWLRRAADNGVLPAQRRLADHAWAASDDALFLQWALPVAQKIANEALRTDFSGHRLSEEERCLLSRCVQAIFRAGDLNSKNFKELADLAARAGDRFAQFFLGLWCAKIDKEGRRVAGSARQINHRMAIHWLTLAGQQGISDAWYAISRIYLKTEFAHRSVDKAEQYLERAAQAGHGSAQLEFGKRLWRKRRRNCAGDVAAAYWLQRACMHGCAEAEQLLAKIASRAASAAWAQVLEQQITAIEDRRLAARVKLAARFGLSKQEALLLDIEAADHGHCLLVDIRDQHVRVRRRLILIQTAEERLALDHVKHLFARVSVGPDEGNYRQRLYRLESARASQSSAGVRPPPVRLPVVPGELFNCTY